MPANLPANFDDYLAGHTLRDTPEHLMCTAPVHTGEQCRTIGEGDCAHCEKAMCAEHDWLCPECKRWVHKHCTLHVDDDLQPTDDGDFVCISCVKKGRQ